MDTEHLARFREALDGWVDERFASKENLKDLAMFHLYLVNLSDADGWVYDGHSLRMGSPMCSLVVRGSIEGAPYVVFTSARTPMASIHIFMRKLEEGLLEWAPDRFR